MQCVLHVVFIYVFLFVTCCFGLKLANCWGMKDSESLWALASMRIGHDVYGVVYEEMYARGQMPIVCKGFVSNSCLRIPLYSLCLRVSLGVDVLFKLEVML